MPIAPTSNLFQALSQLSGQAASGTRRAATPAAVRPTVPPAVAAAAAKAAFAQVAGPPAPAPSQSLAVNGRPLPRGSLVDILA